MRTGPNGSLIQLNEISHLIVFSIVLIQKVWWSRFEMNQTEFKRIEFDHVAAFKFAEKLASKKKKNSGWQKLWKNFASYLKNKFSSVIFSHSFKIPKCFIPITELLLSSDNAFRAVSSILHICFNRLKWVYLRIYL